MAPPSAVEKPIVSEEIVWMKFWQKNSVLEIVTFPLNLTLGTLYFIAYPRTRIECYSSLECLFSFLFFLLVAPAAQASRSDIKHVFD